MLVGLLLRIGFREYMVMGGNEMISEGGNMFGVDEGVTGGEVFIPVVVDVHVLFGTVLCVTFDDDEVKFVDVKPFMEGSGFDEVFALGLFEQVKVDVGFVIWPNGMGLAFEVLYEAEDIMVDVKLVPVSDEERVKLKAMFAVKDDSSVEENSGDKK